MPLRSFDTEEEWREYFEERFPEGVLATFAQTTAADAQHDDSPQVLGVRVAVAGMTDDDPELVVVNLYTDAPHSFIAEDVDEQTDFRVVVKTVDDRFVVLSSRISDEQKAEVKNRLSGGWF